MSITEKIIKAMQDYKGADGMTLSQIRHFLPAEVNNSNADYNMQKLIKEGLVKKGDRNIHGFRYQLTTWGENYNPASMTIHKNRIVEIESVKSPETLPEQQEKADSTVKESLTVAIVKNDLTRLDSAISHLESKHKHYDFMFQGVKIDPYRIFDIYQVNHPALQHAAKKILRAGRSIKSLDQDIDEAIASLQRFKEMRNEERAL